ncbi:MAG: serine/threonine protein kinase [Planctomycetes bacterium]|nr:serine/threonine protein kinase [Planctomycetota bacterium]
MDTNSDALDFGAIALRNRFIAPADLDRAKEMQRQAMARGEMPTLEEVIRALGLMDEDKIKHVRIARDRLQKEADSRANLRITGYEVLSVLGEGGLGTVYKARQNTMNRIVALKVLHKQWVKDEEFRKRFLLEARIVGKMSHQNLVQVFDIGKDNGHYYFSMEYVGRGTVEDLVTERGALTVETAVNIVIQVCRALKYIQDFRLVHRDIKPSNMLLGDGDVVKLGDFGFVKSAHDATLGYDDMVLGTPDYISPEQAMGKEVDFRSDIYSLGASLYHMITGRPPFTGSGSAVMKKHVREEIVSPRELAPDIPESVCHVIEKMMAKRPEDRYQTFDALFADLERLKLHQDPVTERLEPGKSHVIRRLREGDQARISRLEGERDQLRREYDRMRRAVVLLAVVAAAGLALAAGFGAWFALAAR